jgi:hypothetical protein
MYDHELIKRNFIPKEDLEHFLVFENIYRLNDSIIVAYRAPFSERVVIGYDRYLSKVREERIDEVLEPGHYCPYCGHREMLINNYFTHIEWEHPDKPLI